MDPNTQATKAHAPRSALGARASRGERITAGLIAAAMLAGLVIAATLRPDSAGHGTHTQLGIAPCGWAQALGAPCPTCGMTTAVAYAADGRLIAAFLAQPMGMLLGVGAAAGFWGGLHVAATGSTLGRQAAGLIGGRALWAAAFVAAAAWGYKVAAWGGGV